MRSYLSLLCLAVCLILPSSGMYAQTGAGALDYSFNPNDKGFSDLWGANGIVYASAVQPDGKYLIAGQFLKWDNIPANRIARLNPDGTLDASFDPGDGIGNTPAYTIYAMVLLPNDKILIGGRFEEYDGVSRNGIARINADGSLDATFTVGTGFDDYVKTIEVQASGKILVGGNFTTYNGTTANKVVRLNADGTLDVNFSVGTGANAVVNTIATQADGKLVIGGNFTSFNGTSLNRLVRVDSTGNIDNSFDIGTGANNEIDKIIVQADNKIAVVGLFNVYNADSSYRIVRLNANGSKDATFTPGKAVFVGSQRIRNIQQCSNGQYYISGMFYRYDDFLSISHIIRLNTNGQPDTTFKGNAENTIYTFDTLTNGQLIVGGQFGRYAGIQVNNFTRINNDGTLDRDFNPATGLNNRVSTVAVQADGKIIIGGIFSEYFSKELKGIARFHPNGDLDTSFTATITTPNTQSDYPSKILLDTTGKILVIGSFRAINGDTVNNIARLNPDGTRDTSFRTGIGATTATGVPASIYGAHIQADGKILLVGGFVNFNDTMVNRIVRLNYDGSIDQSFNTGTGFNTGSVGSVVTDSVGNIYVAGIGNNVQYNGTNMSTRRILRLFPDGTLDLSFTIGAVVGSGGGGTGPVLPLPDGSIISGGSFIHSMNGYLTKGPFRFLNDGTLDTNFTGTVNSNGGLGINNLRMVAPLGRQSDGKIIVGGDFTSYNGETVIRIMRLLPDGTLDTTFSSGIGPVGTPPNQSQTLVGCAAFYPNDRLMIGGMFTSYDETGRNFIARIHLKECTASTGVDEQKICGDTYTWIDGSEYTSNNNTATYTLVSGAYNGCDSIVTLNLTFTPSFEADVTVNGSTLTTSVSNAAYQWIKCDDNSEITGATNASYTPAQSGEYAVVITKGNCMITSECYYVTGTGIDEPNGLQHSITVYPNPVESVLNIRSSAARYTISNVLGISLKEGKLKSGNNEIDLSELLSGLYLISIINDQNERVVFKINKY